MTHQVCDGASMRCSSGLEPARLRVPPPRGLVDGGARLACIDDHVPEANIPSFGRCRAATPARACMPCTPGPWSPGVPCVTLAGRPALDDGATLRCDAGGVIAFHPRPADGVRLP